MPVNPTDPRICQPFDFGTVNATAVYNLGATCGPEGKDVRERPRDFLHLNLTVKPHLIRDLTAQTRKAA